MLDNKHFADLTIRPLASDEKRADRSYSIETIAISTKILILRVTNENIYERCRADLDVCPRSL